MTIYQLPTRCWAIVPKLPDDARDPHYDTRAAALAAIREAWDEDRDWTFDSRLLTWWREVQYRLSRLRLAAPKPRLLPARCRVIRCDGCEEFIDEQDEGYIAHCDSLPDAERTMASYGWAYVGALALAPAGVQAFCPGCAPEDAEMPPSSPAEQESAGQLRLPGMVT